MSGNMIRVKSRDGFEFDAYHVQATGPRKGGVIVVQEIFGLSDHIKEMTERLGAIRYGQDQGGVSLGMDRGRARDYSEDVASVVDEEVRERVGVVG